MPGDLRIPRWQSKLSAGTLLALGLMALLALARTQFTLCLVKGGSMLPGLRSGDVLLVDKRAYRTAAPARGDIVVARDRQSLIIKRVVGLPGEEVELRWGELHINGVPQAEAYALTSGWLSLGKGRLFADRYALLGDNRAFPDSVSTHAVVPKERILGKVVHTLPFGRLSLKPTSISTTKQLHHPSV